MDVTRTCNLTVRFSKFTFNINIYDAFLGFLSKLVWRETLFDYIYVCVCVCVCVCIIFGYCRGGDGQWNLSNGACEERQWWPVVED